MTETGTYLDRILADRARDLDDTMRTLPLANVRAAAERAAPPLSFTAALAEPGVSLIGELKRTSPSKGELDVAADPAIVARAYAAGGVAAISVLTEERHFQGSLLDLVQVREALLAERANRPLLRKDFIVDPYQVVEARAHGADAVLVIVAIVDDAMLRTLIATSYELGMTPLVEVNNEDEVDRAVAADARVIGINNRDLRTFRVALDTTGRLRPRIPIDRTVIALSGISSIDDVATVRGYGVDAMLVGEALMTAPDPAARAADLIRAGLRR